MNNGEDSITHWIRQLKSGNESAAHPLWDRYFDQLTRLARGKLNGVVRDVDEEDIALSALKSVFIDLREDRYPNLGSRTELWPLLVKITLRKCQNALKRQFAGKRSPRAELRNVSVADILEEKSASEFMVELVDELHRLSNSLGDQRLERIATMRLEGYTVSEIAIELDISERSVARKLRRIRREWREISPA